MGNHTRQVKGRLKEATGVLSSDKKLENEGKQERLAGELLDKLEDFGDNFKKSIEHLVDQVSDSVKRT